MQFETPPPQSRQENIVEENDKLNLLLIAQFRENIRCLCVKELSREILKLEKQLVYLEEFHPETQGVLEDFEITRLKELIRAKIIMVSVAYFDKTQKEKPSG